MWNCDWTLIISAIGTVITTVGLIYGIMRNFKNDINDHLDKLDKRIDKLDVDVKNTNTKFDGWFKSQNERTDRLYEMFVELLKEKRKTDP